MYSCQSNSFGAFDQITAVEHNENEVWRRPVDESSFKGKSAAWKKFGGKAVYSSSLGEFYFAKKHGTIISSLVVLHHIKINLARSTTFYVSRGCSDCQIWHFCFSYKRTIKSAIFKEHDFFRYYEPSASPVR